jgi:hypothetical protein
MQLLLRSFNIRTPTNQQRYIHNCHSSILLITSILASSRALVH